MKRIASIILVLVILFVACIIPLVAQAEEIEKDNYFPNDLFSSKEKVDAFFSNAGDRYEQVDGEWIMTVPDSDVNGYMYSLEPVPYEEYTISYEFSMINDDVHFLIGMSAGGATPWTQISFEHDVTTESLCFKHYRHNGAGWDIFPDEAYEFYEYEMDEILDNTWQSVVIEVKKEWVSVYFNDVLIADLDETEGFFGEKGYIGLRSGPSGYKIKNLIITEGVDDGTESVTPTPTPMSTETPTETSTPELSANPSAATEVPTENAGVPTQTSNDSSKKNSSGLDGWWFALVIIFVLSLCGVILFLFIRQRRKNK